MIDAIFEGEKEKTPKLRMCRVISGDADIMNGLGGGFEIDDLSLLQPRFISVMQLEKMWTKM